jgi:hypothetical protein
MVVRQAARRAHLAPATAISFPRRARCSGEFRMPAVRYPTRYRRLPRGREETARFLAEMDVLFDRGTALDQQQRVLSAQLAEVRTGLAEMRVTMWPSVDPKDIVHGVRVTRRRGPPPIPPVAPNAQPLAGKHLRSTVLAILLREQRPMTLVEVHREVHLGGYAIASREPVKRLADALRYESILGRAHHVDRGVYVLGELSPGTRRRLAKIPL